MKKILLLIICALSFGFNEAMAHFSLPASKLTVSLEVTGNHFKNGQPIIVDVYLTNETEQDITVYQFSPISSITSEPYFVFINSSGSQFSIPPGLYGDDWDKWYQPADGRKAFSIGPFVIPAGKKIHLLHGDLRDMMLRAREHCSGALRERFLLERKENASTKKSYQDIVKFANKFLRGGTYQVYINVSSSQLCRECSLDSSVLAWPQAAGLNCPYR